MIEQHKMDNVGDIENIEDIKSRKEAAIKTLEKARVYHEKYLLRSNNSDLENAVNYYIQAIKQNPEMPETYYRLACLMFENGQISLDSAIEQCKVAVNIDPKNTNAHLYTGYFLKLARDFDAAEKEFKSAIKINPLNAARPRIILASMLYEKINKVKPTFTDFLRMVYYACSGCLSFLWDFASLKMMYKNISDDAIDHALNLFLDPIPAEREAMLRELKGSYRLFLLSNNNPISIACICRTFRENYGYGFDQLFIEMFCSYRMNMSKPSKEIFLKALEIAGADSSQTLFIDDSSANIEAAKELGFVTCLYDVNTPFTEQIRRALANG